MSHWDRHSGTFALDTLDGPSAVTAVLCLLVSQTQFMSSRKLSWLKQHPLVHFKLMCVSRPVRMASHSFQQSDLLLLLTTHSKETVPQWVSKLVSSDVKVQPPLPKHNLWFLERQEKKKVLLSSPPSVWLSQPDFKYNCTCKYSHPPTIIISDYKLQKGKKKHFWFVFYTMITYWLALLTRNSACQIKSRYS